MFFAYIMFHWTKYMSIMHDYYFSLFSLWALHSLCFSLVFISFLCFIVSKGVLEQPRTKHNENAKDGFNTEDYEHQTYAFQKVKNEICFPKVLQIKI